MSSLTHHVIIVSSSLEHLIDQARTKADRVGLDVTKVHISSINGIRTFVILPDGSKNHREDSDIGDARRAAWRFWANNQRHEDGSTNLWWAEVAYGEPFEPESQCYAEVTQHAWTNEPGGDDEPGND